MVLAWRKVFCAFIPPEQPDSTAIESELEYDHGISSSSSTPRLRSEPVSSQTLGCPTTATVPSPSPSTPISPKLQYEINNSPRFCNPYSPRFHSPFSFLKSSLRLCSRRCGLCLQSMKKRHGTTTFTAECSHTFHFRCISDHVKTQGSFACPVCSCLWKELPMLSVDDRNHIHQRFIDDVTRPDLKVYNDDEPLASLTPKARFNPIPESDENCDEEGFCVNDHGTDVEVRLSPEAAVMITASRSHLTYAIVHNVKAPAATEKLRRAPIDVVVVVDLTGKITNDKLQMMKKAMRLIVSSLSSSDRLSIVAFSSHSKRLLPLKRMTTSGKRAARCIVEAMAVLHGTSNSKDAVKKAVKVLLDRREKNPVATVILISDVVDQSPSSSVSSIRYSHSRLDIHIHSLKLAVNEDRVIAKYIVNLLNVVVQDLRMQLGLVFDSPAEIAGVYSCTPQPTILGASTVEIGELLGDEERELLVEINVFKTEPKSEPKVLAHQVISVGCCYRESSSQEIIHAKQQTLIVPRPTIARSSSLSIQRLRNVFILTRAVAESRRLVERNDLTGAYKKLVCARGLMQQYTAPGNEFTLGLEAELSVLQRRLKVQVRAQQLGRFGVAPVVACTDEKGEPLTPTSAWRMADKLAKVAMMRKSVNRVGDLHGFKDARF